MTSDPDLTKNSQKQKKISLNLKSSAFYFLDDLKLKVVGQAPAISTQLWKSIIKWSEDKFACEKEVQILKENYKTFYEKRGFFP